MTDEGDIATRDDEVGLDAAGKTTILYKLYFGESGDDSTIGSASRPYTRTFLSRWDVGGQDKIRPLWRHY